MKTLLVRYLILKKQNKSLKEKLSEKEKVIGILTRMLNSKIKEDHRENLARTLKSKIEKVHHENLSGICNGVATKH